MKQLTLIILLMLLLSTWAFGQPVVDDEEFVGPFASWMNAQTDFGAVGDGVADDTAALQKALDALEHKSYVLYIPAGTYRITAGLIYNSRMDVTLLGEDPAKTIIKWDGPDEGTMLFCNGVRFARYGRITWDGSGKKVTAVFHEWDGHTPNAATGLQHTDEWFRDVAFGIRAGKPHFMDAECNVLRCKFQRVSVAGVRIQSFNALDWFIWDSEFDDCNVGVTNDPGAGNFHVLRNIFRNSKVADITMRNACYFSIRHNLSISSNRFIEARDIGGWAVDLTLQGNTIIDPAETVAISINNPGPTLLFDNVVKSRAGVTEGPVVRLAAGLDGEYVAVGNTFTVLKPFTARGRFLELETKIAVAKTITPPALPGAVTPQSKQRPVIELPASATAVELQAAIQKANALKGKRPIIHLPAGGYALEQTVTIPAELDVQLVGDGNQTRLNWTGAANGTIFALAGPVRATFRDLSMWGDNGKATGIRVTNCDQPGARIFGDDLWVHGCREYGLLVDGLEQADVSLRTFYHSDNTGVSVKVAGGPHAAVGERTPARTVIFGGASSNSAFNYDVSNGGRLMAQDIWYEGAPPTFMKLSGTGSFTLSGAQIAPGRPGPNALQTDPTYAGITLDDFRGKATFLTTIFGTRVMVRGDGDGANLLLMGIQANDAEYLVSPPAKARVAVINSRRYASGPEGAPPTRSLPDVGTPDPQWVLQMLEQVRTDTPRLLTTIPDHATDLRFFRVSIDSCATGMHLKGGEK